MFHTFIKALISDRWTKTLLVGFPADKCIPSTELLVERDERLQGGPPGMRPRYFFMFIL